MENNSTKVDQQRSIQFAIAQGAKRAKKLDNSGAIFALYSPKKIVIKLTEYTNFNTSILVNMADDIYAIVDITPTLLKLGLKLVNDLTEDKKILCFDLQNQTFSKTFFFEINEVIGSLVIINENPNKMLAIYFKMQKVEKEKKRKKETHLRLNFVNIVNIVCYTC